MPISLRKFVEELQHKDRATRRKWLIGLTAVSMGLVLMFYVQYIRSFVVINESRAESNTPAFAAVFSAGLEVLKEQGKALAERIRARLQTSHSITIENPERNFVPDDLAPITPGTLPQ